MNGLHAFGKIFDFSSGPCFVRERERKRDVRIRVYEPSIHGFEGLWGRKDIRRRRESVVSRKSLIARERGKN